jgi:N6-L-threonylcarbamoyladenine synthase
MRDWGDYEILGGTIDDAVGEAFDKVAKALGLPYPGGPEISRLAAMGDPAVIEFPRALMHSHDFRFSLSGLKTAVMTYIDAHRNPSTGAVEGVPDICAGFEAAVIDVQVHKVKEALRQTGAPTFCLGGGVAANRQLRAAYEKMCKDLGVNLVVPPLSACGDNAAMIALAALPRFKAGKFMGLNGDAAAHADLSESY